MRSEAFKRRLGFNFTVTANNFILLLKFKGPE